MSDPTSTAAAASKVVAFTGVAAAATAVLSPIFGQYSLIVIGGFFGALFALSSVSQLGLIQIALFMFRGVGASVTFTSLFSYLAAPYLHVDTALLWMPMSGLIAMYTHKMFELGLETIKVVSDFVQSWIKKRLED